MKFTFICTHAIHNLIPLFLELSKKKNIKFSVLYWQKLKENFYDPEFNKIINFGVDFYKGYSFDFLENKNKLRYDFSFIFKFKIFFKLIKFIYYNNSETLLFYGYTFPHVFGAIFAKLLKKKTIMRSVSYDIGNRNIFLKFLRSIYYRLSNLFFDQFWSVGILNTLFYQNFGVKKKKIKLIDSSQIDYTLINKKLQNITRKNILKKHNLPLNKKYMLFAARFKKMKNPTLLIESFIHANVYKDWKLLMVGDGSLKYKMKSISGEHLNKNIFILNYQNQIEISELYKISDILVLSSNFGETHGNVICEAIQFGCAILTSDRVGLHPEVKKYKIGSVFNPYTKKNLSKEINKITNNVGLLKLFKINASKYSIKKKPKYVANLIIKHLS